MTLYDLTLICSVSDIDDTLFVSFFALAIVLVIAPSIKNDAI